MSTDLGDVQRAVGLLAGEGVQAWIFGGWAEELRGLRGPSEHRDVDLLCPAESWNAVDAAIRRRGLAEVVAKRKPHKRAFVVDGVLVELLLVRGDCCCYTELAGRRHEWPDDMLAADGVASVAALTGYRATYRPPRTS